MATKSTDTRELSKSLSDAQVVRRKRWHVGTRIVGDEGYGPTEIEITAIGHQSVLARRVEGDHLGYEATWTFSCRDWQKVIR